MLIKKLIALCKQAKMLQVYNDAETQYISDGRCIYPVYKDFEFSSHSLCEIYDLDAEKMLLLDHAGLPMGVKGDDAVPDEVLCELLPIQIYIHGAPYLALKSDSGIAFIKKALLSPLADEDPANITIYERKLDDGGFYYAVKIGMILYAIVQPTQILTDAFVTDIKNFAQLCEETHGRDS